MLFNLKVDEPHMNVIFAALGKLPLEQSVNTFDMLRAQVQQQATEAQAAAQQETGSGEATGAEQAQKEPEKPAA